jgi:hypothetical protein
LKEKKPGNLLKIQTVAIYQPSAGTIRQGKRRVIKIPAYLCLRVKYAWRYGNPENTDHVLLLNFWRIFKGSFPKTVAPRVLGKALIKK